jgi:hypothetical protein
MTWVLKDEHTGEYVSEIGPGCLTYDEKQSAAVRFTDQVRAYRVAKKWDLLVVRLAPSRERLDRQHGVLPLGQAKCDECSELAFTRYYENIRTKNERVVYTVCQKHDHELHERTLQRLKEFALRDIRRF